MQHLYDFIKSKKLPVKDILSKRCTITEKIDGSAFQYYNTGDNIVYGKRSETLYKLPTNILDDFDLLMSPMYINAYNVINTYKDKLESNVKSLNFEIFDNINSHIMEYDKFKNNMVLLSGIYMDDTAIPEYELIKIADLLNISVNVSLYDGYLRNEDIAFITETNNIQNSDIWNIICNYCNINHDKNTEGFVLTFYNDNNDIIRVMKIQSPVFHDKIINKLDNEKKNKADINFENIYSLFIDGCFVKSKYEHPISRIIEMYFACEICNKDFHYENNLLQKTGILNNIDINITQAKKYYSLFPDNINDIEYVYILKFMLLVFRNKRVKFPLWCSLEYQLTKVNPFIDNFIL